LRVKYVVLISIKQAEEILLKQEFHFSLASMIQSIKQRLNGLARSKNNKQRRRGVKFILTSWVRQELLQMLKLMTKKVGGWHGQISGESREKLICTVSAVQSKNMLMRVPWICEDSSFICFLQTFLKSIVKVKTNVSHSHQKRRPSTFKNTLRCISMVLVS